MTIGLMSTGGAGRAEDLLTWPGRPGRDEFFWITEVNKATLLTNLARGLLAEEQAKAFGRGVAAVEKACAEPGAARPKMYIRYEPLLVKAAGLEATLMHAGRSSQDIHATFQRAIVRDETLALLEALLGVVRALLAMAHANGDVLVPCYTNGVAAQPSNLAHVLLAHAQAFLRDIDRTLAFYDRLNECPMGSCVLNGTGWPLDRDGMASLLGFDRPVENTFDASQVGGTDVFVEEALILVHPMLQTGQLIAEVMQQYAQPRPWILVTSTYASSAMPQKRNPGPLIDIRRDAGASLAALNSVVMRAHNLPTGMYDAKDEKLNREVIGDATDVLRRFADVIGLLKVDKARALEELNLDWTASQELADVLMRDHQIPFRVGHRFASAMVTVARTEGFTPLTFPHDRARAIWTKLAAELAPELPDLPEELALSEAAFRATLDPARIIAERAVSGGPQPAELSRLLEKAPKDLEDRARSVEKRRARVAQAQERLDAAFRSLIARPPDRTGSAWRRRREGPPR